MKSNVVIWWILAVFFLICTVVYAGWGILSHLDAVQAGERTWNEAVEWPGAIALLFSTFMSAMIAFFIQKWHASQKGLELAADRLDADIDDDDPEMGEFSPWSWWPLVLSGAVALGALGLAVGTFLIPLAAGLLVVALVGWTYEYYRGNFAR
ncbi:MULTISPECIES: aa3-type cytochrome oxidase subunit IV [unclassified Microbacterium]|uniref:aa3-type cytochrome oxidase subunit IV n=1 Tax=unclassified Microbacterium TaxID=2609290 RepID=UPI00097E8B8B|nr:cytochrome c oxidase subunit 4 [Microbacterium sp. JB110]RCS62757.1 cytochrome c oxidase subunit 4 [Microbacterium sp. JB110]SJM62943.1 Probable cytochrome c oxidase polypeptide 4 [Frigoribacterium sp. JB110]